MLYINILCSIIFIATTFVGEISSYDDYSVIKTSQGSVRGLRLRSRHGREFAAFLGIPFAKPPVGPLRLMPPVAADPWEGVRDATRDAPICVQQLPKLKNGTITGSEDCLYVNVYTPLKYRSIFNKHYPVMIWIYGGGFLIGSATNDDYNPYYLMDKDVVLVTVNYRLGNFGFFSLEDNVISGNYGLKDQREAFRWVQKHIRSYNGNPNEVTIFGQSAGAVSTSLHLISPLSKGLFKRVISQSGTALSFWSISHKGEVREYAMKFIKAVKCHRRNSYEILRCLQDLPAERFLFNLLGTLGITLKSLPFDMRIVREPSDAQEPFLVGNPWDEIKRPNDINWILGINSAEGNLIAEPIYTSNELLVKLFEASSAFMLPRLLGYYDTADFKDHGNITRKIKDFYFENRPIKKSIRQFVNMFTDRIFLQPAIDSVRLYPGKTYFYYYDHVNRLSKMYNGTNSLGATHSDELYSLFHFPTENVTAVQGVDAQVSEQIIEYWTNFATYGSPNSIGNELPYWSPVTNKEEIEYLHIHDGLVKMEKNLKKEAYELWSSFPIAKDY